jgi:hypothetical protein
MPQIHRRGRWPRALNIGYPNAFDKAMERDGLADPGARRLLVDGLLRHDQSADGRDLQAERAGLAAGQQFIPVHVFPFRDDGHQPRAHADSDGSRSGATSRTPTICSRRTRVPPSVQVCGKKYVVREGLAPGGIQTASAGTDTAADCVDTRPIRPSRPCCPMTTCRAGPGSPRSRKVVSKTQRRRSAGRNARKAYAEAAKFPHGRPHAAPHQASIGGEGCALVQRTSAPAYSFNS